MITVKYISKDQEALLVKALETSIDRRGGKNCDQRDIATTRFLLNTGLRIGEFCQLKRKDVKDGVLHVRRSITKRKKARDIPLNREAKKAWREIWIHSGPSRCIRFFQRKIKAAGIEAGIAFAVTPHVLRHTFATRLMERGVSGIVIQELLGHKDFNTTKIYTHVTKAHAQQCLEKLND